MTKAIASTKSAIHAIPNVAGTSRRVKAEPTKLSPLAGRIMSASGAFTGRRAAGTISQRREFAGLPLGRIALAILLLSTAIALGLDVTQHSVVALVPLSNAHPVQANDLVAVGIGDSLEHLAIARRPKTDVEPHDFADRPSGVDGQGRFEISRLIRLSSTARGNKDQADRSRPTRPPSVATR